MIERGMLVVMAGFAPSLLNFRGHLLRAMRSSGWQITCTAPESDREVSTMLQDWDIGYRAIGVTRSRISPIADMFYLARVWRLFREIAPQAVLAYTIKPVVFGLLGARMAGVKRRYALITGLGYTFSSQSVSRAILRRTAVWLYRVALRGAEAVIFQNSDDRDCFVSLGIVPAGQAHVVPGSGVDLRHFGQQPFGPVNEIVFVMIARLVREKGVREFVSAATEVRQECPATRFVLVGPVDPSPDAITADEIALWKRTGVVEYLGEVKDVRPQLGRASVYVLPSYREGTPRTVLEAMATGRPVITTDVPGCRGTIENGVSGFLVPAQNVAALVAAMKRFVAEPHLIRTMGAAGRARAEAVFDVAEVNGHFLAIMGIGAHAVSQQGAGSH